MPKTHGTPTTNLMFQKILGKEVLQHFLSQCCSIQKYFICPWRRNLKRYRYKLALISFTVKHWADIQTYVHDSFNTATSVYRSVIRNIKVHDMQNEWSTCLLVNNKQGLWFVRVFFNISEVQVHMWNLELHDQDSCQELYGFFWVGSFDREGLGMKDAAGGWEADWDADGWRLRAGDKRHQQRRNLWGMHRATSSGGGGSSASWRSSVCPSVQQVNAENACVICWFIFHIKTKVKNK